MRKLTATSLAAVLALSACTRDAPTAPDLPEDSPDNVEAAARFNTLGGGMLLSSPALDDIRVRLLPGFTDPSAADAFGGHLAELDAALVAGDADAARTALASARSVIDPNGDGTAITVIDRADAGVILLVLEQTERGLD